MEHEIIICKCESPEHQIIFSYFLDNDIDREVYMTIHLRPESNIFKRMWIALKYIFGYRSKYEDFDNMIIGQRDVYKLVKILRYLNPNIFNN